MAQFAFTVAIPEALWLLAGGCADDPAADRHIEQIIMGMTMAESATSSCDLYNKGPHKLVINDKMVLRLLADVDDVTAIVACVFAAATGSADSLLNQRIMRRLWMLVLQRCIELFL